MKEVLRVDAVTQRFGGLTALDNINMYVHPGEIVGVIGPNGAGKTTLFNVITGIYNPTEGKVFLEEQDITHWSSKKKVQEGIVLSPEGRQIFPKFTVLENLRMGGYLRTRQEVDASLEVVYDLFPKLKERANQQGGTLSGGEQQMLAVGRAVMANPTLLLLDEPSLGLAPLIVKDIFTLIQRIREMGTTVLLVEQNARSALKISDRAYVLETGKLVLQGTAQELLNSSEVQKAHLGM